MRSVMPSRSWPGWCLIVPSELMAFPAGWKGLPGTRTPTPGRTADGRGVCVRILPTTYAQLQRIQRRMRLKTVAAAWEFLLRLGIAAAERLATR
jgi:hypothetical protein